MIYLMKCKDNQKYYKYYMPSNNNNPNYYHLFCLGDKGETEIMFGLISTNNVVALEKRYEKR